MNPLMKIAMSAASCRRKMVDPLSSYTFNLLLLPDRGLWKDAARTMACTADGDIIYSWWDNIRNIGVSQSNTLYQPILRITDGVRWVDFSGGKYLEGPFTLSVPFSWATSWMLTSATLPYGRIISIAAPPSDDYSGGTGFVMALRFNTSDFISTYYGAPIGEQDASYDRWYVSSGRNTGSQIETWLNESNKSVNSVTTTSVSSTRIRIGWSHAFENQSEDKWNAPIQSVAIGNWTEAQTLEISRILKTFLPDPVLYVPGVIQRYRFSDIRELPGTSIGSWRNIGSYGGSATQATSGDRPIIQSDGLYFDGTTDFMSLPSFAGTGLSELSVFILAKNTLDPPVVEAGAGPFLGGIGNAASISHTPYIDGNIYDGFATDTRKTVGNVTPDLADWFIYEASSKNGLWEAWVNGIFVYSSGTNTFGLGLTPAIGGEGYYRWGGKIREIIFLNRASTTLDGDRQVIRDYLWNSLTSDVYASEWISAIETTLLLTTSQKDAIYKFWRTALNSTWGSTLKSARWTMPIWGNAAANALNPSKPQEKGSWTGGVTHASGYVQGNGSTGYFNLGTSASSFGLTNGQGSIFSGVYQLVGSGDRFHTGMGGSSISGLQAGGGGGIQGHWAYGNIIVGVTTNPGVWMFSRAGGVNRLSNKRAAGYDTVTSSTSPAGNIATDTQNIIMLARNDSGGVTSFSQDRLFAVGWSPGTLNDSEMQSFSAALTTLWSECTGLTL